MIDINRIRNNKEEVEKALLKRMDNVKKFCQWQCDLLLSL